MTRAGDHPIRAQSGAPTTATEGAHTPVVVIDRATGDLYYRPDGDGDYAKVNSSITGVATGYKIARGESALDGSNPTPITTGLTSVSAFTATIKSASAPGDGTSVLTASISGGTVNVYGWKNTGGTDPTLVASTGTDSFYWIAVGA